MNNDFNEAVRKTILKYEKLHLKFDQLTNELEQYKSEPIAIIGMSCRFPNGANNIDAYWNLLRKGDDGTCEVPLSRWNVEDYYDPDPEVAGKMITKRGGFLNVDLAQFDADFFGISPREAEYLDPKQRLLLEVSYEALESAGIAPSTLNESLTGVFVGICASDYIDLERNDTNFVTPYLVTGNAPSVATGRVSFTFGLQGPNFAIDTACSSSLVAIDQACKSLRAGESNLALAGGVNIILSPKLTIYLSKAGMLAPDGHCKTFDAAADGYVRSEGCGMIALKRLSDAKRDGDAILALIKASGINQDGASSGLTVPSGKAQESLINTVLAKANLKGADIDYVETHGTGTAVGDPIEVRAIGATYGVRDEVHPLLIGSVKSNIGHLETAAGIAAFIKVVLALQHENLPPDLNFTNLNPRIEKNFPVEIITENRPWKRGEHIRRAAVSSFGFSGTNAHLVLEEAPLFETKIAEIPERSLHILTISAKTESSLATLVERYLTFLDQTTAQLPNICYSANTGRDHERYRIAVLAKDLNELKEKLRNGDFFKGEAGEFTSFDISDTNEGSKRLDQLAIAYTKGAHINWKKIDEPYARVKVTLPQYPFQRSRHWSKFAVSFINKSRLMPSSDQHPLLSHRTDSPAFEGTIFESEVDEAWPDFIKDHQIYGVPVVAGAVYLSAALSAAQILLNSDYYEIEDVEVLNPIILQKSQKKILQTIVYKEENEKRRFEILSRDLEEINQPKWIIHAHGWIKNEVTTSALNKVESIEEIKSRCLDKYTGEDLGQFCLDKLELKLGGHFKWIDHLYIGDGELLARMRSPIEKEEKQGYVLYPGFIDSCFQMLLVRLLKDKNENKVLFVPISLGAMTYDRRLGPPEWVHVTFSSASLEDMSSVKWKLLNADGCVSGEFSNFMAKPASRTALLRGMQHKDSIESWLYRIIWKAEPLEKPTEDLKGTWLVFGDNHDLTEQLVKEITKKGCNCIQVAFSDKFLKISDQCYEINVQNKKDFEALIKSVLLKGPYTGIVFLGIVEEPKEPSLESIERAQNDETKSLLYLFQTVIQAIQPSLPCIYIVTNGIQPVGKASLLIEQTPIMGLRKSILLEYPSIICHHIDLESVVVPNKDAVSIINEMINVSGEDQVVYRAGIRYVPRLMPHHAADKIEKKLSIPYVDTYHLETEVKGHVSNLILNSKELPVLNSQEILVEVKAAGLNFRDVLNVKGLDPGDARSLGLECAGVVKSVGAEVSSLKVGDDVLGLSSGCFSNLIIAKESLFVVKPKTLNFVEAAAIPIVFVSAYHALHNLAKLKAGEKVLIHATDGPFCLAAVQVARQIGAEAYVSAESDEMQAYLSQLDLSHIYRSRNLTYAEDILQNTKGSGVDVVLNYLSSEGIVENTLSICSQNARLVEIIKSTVSTKEEMIKARPDVNYFVLALDQMIERKPHVIQATLNSVISKFIEGKYQRLPCTSFPLTEAQLAFENLEKGASIGKIVLIFPAFGCSELDPQGSYLVTGGFGGLGLKIGEWLISKGAQHLVLVGRHEPQENVLQTIRQFRDQGIQVEIAQTDIADAQSVDMLMQKFGSKWPKLKGIFHLAGILDDATLLEQNWDRFKKVFASKVNGSFNLHHYAKDLDLFVLFSSMASIFGNAGQSNYAAANSFMDSLCEYRKQRNLPTLSISWGPWSEIGMAKDHLTRHAKGGVVGMNTTDGIRALEMALRSQVAHLTIANINWNRFINQWMYLPAWLKHFANKKENGEYLNNLLEKTPPKEHLRLIKAQVIHTLREVLGLAAFQSIDEKQGFFDMGLDSLMAVEVKNHLQRSIGNKALISSTAVFDYSNVSSLGNYIAEILGIRLENDQKIDSAGSEKNLLDEKNKAENGSRSEINYENLHIEFEQYPSEPIAIIGMGCRFPSGANSIDAYWNLMHSGVDGISEIPINRWDADEYYSPDPEEPGKMITKRGGFLDVDVSQFDAEFFGISPREAEYLDPQQRLLLEVCHEALESAGIASSTLDGSLTGVFIGICTRDYLDMLTATNNRNLITSYVGSGNTSSTASGRLSFIYGFQGPNFAVDTACSSSLVAIDQACESLRHHQSNLALAGGVNLMLFPNFSIDCSKAGMLAPDGHCKTFDASADGYARGEGCGVVVLKRLSDARRDRDKIFAVIKAGGINQDGASSGLTVPNGKAQEALIRNVLAKAKLKGSDIDYIEAHGTGTSLGDPIEVRAIGATYGVRDAAHPLILGSAKTNVGHLEGAAGVAGVIKAVLALQHETLPPHLNFKKLNPRIEMNFPGEIITQNRPWKRGERIRRAAVSSFGFSGTNAHLILEEAPLLEPKIVEIPERPLHILTLSAKTEFSLNVLIQSYLVFLDQTKALLADICYSANTGRNHERYRIAVIAKDVNELKEKLKSGDFLKGELREAFSFDFSITDHDEWSKLLNELAIAYAKRG